MAGNIGSATVKVNFEMTPQARSVLRGEIASILFDMTQEGGDEFTAWVRSIVRDEVKGLIEGQSPQAAKAAKKEDR